MRLALITRGGGLEFLEDSLRDACPDADLTIWPEPEAQQADVAICWDPEPGILQSMPNLRLVHSIGAGVDKILNDPDVPDVPICRIRGEGLAEAMGEYCHWSTIWFQRHFDRIVLNARARDWCRFSQRAASDMPVCVLGLGDIGRHVAERLRDTGYPVHGWSRSPRDISGITCHTGPEGLNDALCEAMVLICLLPLTPLTNGLLDHALLSRLPQGAGLVLCSRGNHLVHDDFLALMRSGHLRGAVLDVFPTEPLPVGDPLWLEPGVLVTPHMSALAKPRHIAEQIAENVRRIHDGQALMNIVDREVGY